MASYLRPRRGKKATATSNNIVLKRGEVFFEVPDTGVGTGMGKIKMGDGTTAYGSLPYFNEAIDPSTITGIQNSITQLNNDIANKANHLHIYLSGSESTLKSDLDSTWTKFSNQHGTIFSFSNQTNIYYGILSKYSANSGSIIFADNSGTYVKIYQMTSSGSSLREVLVETNTYSLNTVNKTILGAINELNSAVTLSTFTLTAMVSNVTLSYGHSARWGKVVYVKRMVEFAPVSPGSDWSIGAGAEFISGFPKGDWMTDILLVDGSGNFKGTIRINENGRAYAYQRIGVGNYSIFGTYITTE